MSNSSLAGKRIASLLDDNSFVEIGAGVTARSTDFNMEPSELAPLVMMTLVQASVWYDGTSIAAAATNAHRIDCFFI